jgi:hypothetical protein
MSRNPHSCLTLLIWIGAALFVTVGTAPSARAAQKNKQTPPPAEVDEPTADEVQPSEGSEPRGPSLAGNFIAIGPGFTGNLGAEGMGYSFSGGHAWDMRGAMLTLLGDITLQGDAWLLDGGVGARFFPADSDTAPYLGAFFGLGASKAGGAGFFGGELAGGFATGGDAGVQLFRTSDIHLELGATFRVFV